MRRTRQAFTLLLLISQGILVSQHLPVIHIKKDRGQLIFFQKGAKTDSIAKNKSDLFYFIVPDSLKKNISVLVENGQLIPTKNDSLFLLRYLYGVRYESLYAKDDKGAFVFRCLINGASAADKNKILLQIVDKKDEEVLLENRFLYIK